MYRPGLGTLAVLPIELLHNIALQLVADTPLGPPAQLVPLLLASHALNAVLSANSLKARIFRLKFDERAVERRSLRPYDSDLADQLVHACTLLQALKHADVYHDDTHSHLFTAYLLMLDNDGRNFAQLEWAGLDRYVDTFVRRRLWEDRASNEGWPLDNAENACALWLIWMTTTRAKLVAESLQQREEIVLSIIPYVLQPQRYAAAEAPPNHFHLPLSPSNPWHQPPLCLPIPSLNPARSMYPHYLPPSRSINQVHFRARPQLSPPLISVAAKLLFVSRREVFPIRVPPDLPPGLTREDYAELNKGKAAMLPRGARWDWDAGRARAVNLEEGADDQADEESRKWDTEWWRRRLCWDCMAPRPRFTPGLVFTPGCMRGLWQGRIYIPQGDLFNQLLHSPVYPGLPDENGLFSERSLGLIMQPVFLNIEEHHRICGCSSRGHSASCASSSTSIPTSAPHATASATSTPTSTPTPAPTSASSLVHANGCGIIPVPAPSPLRIVRRSAHGAPDVLDLAQVVDEEDMNEDDGEGDEVEVEEDEGDVNEDIDEDAAAAAALSNTQDHDQAVNFPDRIDMSMANAWFPGRLGGVSFLTRAADASAPVGGGGAGGGGEAGTGTGTATATQKRRDEIIFGLDYERGDYRALGGCASLTRAAAVEEKGGVEAIPEPPHPSQHPASTSYVYETYDPARASSHDPSTCKRCAEWDAARRRERRRAEEEEVRVLEGFMKGYGVGVGVGMGEEDRKELEELDVSGFGLDVDLERVLDTASATAAGNEDSDEEMASSSSSVSGMDTTDADADAESHLDHDETIDILGDDLPSGQPALYTADGTLFAEATRREFDRARVGVAGGCCGGVRDVVLTGEADPRHAVWQQQRYAMYGRVRPWDGLVGILRVGYVPSVNYIFICGYLVGETNFVGEWRVAAADPLRPTWGSAFVMSRRRDEQEGAAAAAAGGGQHREGGTGALGGQV